MQRTVVLLRGINVGGHHLMLMADLRVCFAELGCADVATYIQSGNVVCTAPVELSAEATASVLMTRFKFAIPVVLRTAAEIKAVVTTNPFTEETRAMQHVMFFDTPPAPAAWQALETKCTGDERLALRGREAYLLLPHGAGRSKLALAAPALPGSPTMRNWKTVLQLRSML